ncbi:MAG: hypothetical protein JW940_29700 [Polyangiaceae bacterium]|nr:hypothetical protein [Polyangiaceae bacterium]
MTSTRWHGSRWSFVLARLGRAAMGLVAACLASEPAPAAAEGAALELVWTAPRDCPMREQVLAKSEQLLGGQAERAVSAEGTIRTHPDGFELVLRAKVEGVELGRRLVAPRCDELADAAALILAMAARPEQQGSSETEAPASSSPTHASGARAARTTPSKRTVRSPVAPPAASAPAAPRLPPPTRPYAMFTGSVDRGTLPSSSLALGGGVGVWRGRWGAEGQMRHWLKRQRDNTNTPGKGVVLWLNAGSFLGCVAGPLGTAACGGLEVGSLSGRGYGVDEPQPRSVIWAAGLASARLRLVPARWLWLAASVEAAVPIKRYEFRLERVGSVYGPSDICLRAGVQAGVVFGSRN